jgi:hypothetical protein
MQRSSHSTTNLRRALSLAHKPRSSTRLARYHVTRGVFCAGSFRASPPQRCATTSQVLTRTKPLLDIDVALLAVGVMSRSERAAGPVPRIFRPPEQPEVLKFAIFGPKKGRTPSPNQNFGTDSSENSGSAVCGLRFAEAVIGRNHR